ncbi:hypothetical protein HK098_007792 [Nowakowskiella sp. JEL0407]|nr:hypothetical protein HK098_007792 [Nowakowskiella sp. JEL0407]
MSSENRTTWEELNILSFIKTAALSIVFLDTVTYPIDVVKTRMLADEGKKNPTMTKMFRSIIKNEGYRGLYRGYAIALTYMLTNEYVYHKLEQRFKNGSKEHKSATEDLILHGIAGASADFAALSFYVPLEVISQKMQMETKANAPRLRDVTSEIYRKEGLRGFYRGFHGAFACYITVSALFWGSYEAFRTQYELTIPKPENQKYTWIANFTENLIAGAFGSVVSAVLTNPLDVIRVRYQLATAESAKIGYLQFAGSVLRQEGWGIWKKGLRPRLISWIPFILYGMPAYEQFKTWNRKD